MLTVEEKTWIILGTLQIIFYICLNVSINLVKTALKIKLKTFYLFGPNPIYVANLVCRTVLFRLLLCFKVGFAQCKNQSFTGENYINMWLLCLTAS